MSSSDRRPYLTATVLDQALLDACHDNLECRLEMVCDIEDPDGNFIRASDRNKYVGGVFYEALLKFPVISRTVGDWLVPDLQFSTLQLELTNVDGRFNQFLPSGSNYDSWVGKSVEVKLGLAEVSGTYSTVFKGTVTPVGGFRRNVKSISLISRDQYDKINVQFPNTTLTSGSFPKIEARYIGKVLPVIYGDYTVELDPAPAAVPAFATNGDAPFVNGKPQEVAITVASPGVFTAVDHDFDPNQKVMLATNGSLPSPLVVATPYYIKVPSDDDFQLSLTPGGAAINLSGPQSGTHQVEPFTGEPRDDVEFLICDHDLLFLDTAHIYLKRGELYYLVPSSEVVGPGAGNRSFSVVQDTATLWVEAAAYLFDTGDEFYVRVKGKDLGAYSDNIVWQARDLLLTYGGVLSGDLASNWETYRDKASPAQSAIANFKSRVWENEPTPLMAFALSLLEQVRLEGFIDRDLKIRINSLHFEDWDAASSHVVRNWDVAKDSFATTTEERNNFNRAQGAYNFLPVLGEEARATAVYKNSLAITQARKDISKRLIYPNLYQADVVANQLTETLRIASSGFEIIATELTWRTLLRDIGDFVLLDVKIGSAIFENVPAMVRDVGYDPAGLKIPVKLWCMQLLPFPGWEPGYAGTVGGYNATITQE